MWLPIIPASGHRGYARNVGTHDIGRTRQPLAVLLAQTREVSGGRLLALHIAGRVNAVGMTRFVTRTGAHRAAVAAR
jgi:hypothetical protein